jgi:class 3 adenylate cyclase/predicted ATPase
LVARFGRIVITPSRLRKFAQCAPRVAGALGSGRAALMTNGRSGKGVHELGSEIFTKLFPEAIRRFLDHCSARFLVLQLTESLIEIPWESAFDGTQLLCEKFVVVRQIICDEQAPSFPPARASRETLHLLIIEGGVTARLEDAAPQHLLAQLAGVEHLAVRWVRSANLRAGEALELIGESEVVQYSGLVGGVSDIDGDSAWWPGEASVNFRQIAALPHPPRLLVSTGDGNASSASAPGAGRHALAAACARSGLSMLTWDATFKGEAGTALLSALYRELARGAFLGEALWHANVAVRTHPTTAAGRNPEAVLYGDFTIVVFHAAGRQQQSDHIRQVTIMSHDLVDSTRLLQTLGAEGYSALLAGYHEQCRQIVTRHGGLSDDPQGDDGIMCYFGIPVAYEDSAAHALQAALEIAGAVAKLQVKVRIGIVTGQVVVREGQAVGASIHLAARLRSIAEPGMVVAGESTRQIVKEKFVFQRLDGVPHLKGFDRPGAVYRVISSARSDATGRIDTAPTPTPFVGRAHELNLMAAQWAAACGGALRTVLVRGEAGIGKSRMVREFRRIAALPENQMVECRCTPDHVHSAYHPVIEFLRRLLGIQDRDSTKNKLDRIEAALTDSEVQGAAQYIATLLSIPVASRYGSLTHTPERQRQLMLDVLVGWIRKEAERAPLCLIIEDVQWIDPSTKEFLDRLIVAAARLPMLIVLTERLDLRYARVQGYTATEIELKSLSRDEARELIIGVCGESVIPTEVIRLLTDKADGVPLFIEESTRMAVDDRARTGAGEALTALSFTVPSTIEDLLMERLDRLATAKPVAQLGATIGREFTLALLKAVLAHENLPIRVDNLGLQLATLLQAGLLLEKGAPPHASYYFKHALVRDAAYHSLWERDRERLHRAIAVIVSSQFPALEESQPELLAYHYAKAGLDAEATTYWERAARRAAARSAHAEAIIHLTNGLGRVKQLPAPQERDRKELTLQLLLAGQLIATEGYGAERVGRVYARALELSRAVGNEGDIVKAQFGLEAYHFMRADFAQAYAIALQTAEMTSLSSQSVPKLQSQWAVANIQFHQGDVKAAVQRMDACLDAYHGLAHRPSVVQDPGVMCLCYSAWGMWELGYPDQAIARAKQVVGLAQTLNHPFSMGEAYGFSTAVHHFRGENEQALKCAEQAIKICEEGGFAVWLAHAKLMRGRILAEHGDPAAGIDEMRQAYEMWAATGAVVTTPFYLAMQAEGLGLAGSPDDGLALLRSAYDIVCRYGERYYESEVMRLLGELTLQSGARRGVDTTADAERWFLQALESARVRELRSMTLRVTTSLARLWVAHGRTAQAMRLLQLARDSIDEGAETRDVRAASALLKDIHLLANTGRLIHG